MKKSTIIRLVSAIGAAAIITAAFAFGTLYATDLTSANPLYRVDTAMSDALFMRETPISGEVVVIGLDALALEYFGPFPWPRDIMAMTLEMLNEDPENRPAVIGIDLLYTGDSDADADAYLAEAAGAYGNVVVAMSGVFGDRIVTEGEDFRIEKDVIVSSDVPFPALAESAVTGHVNAVLDEDGVMRHALRYITLPDGTVKYSLDITLYERYMGREMPDLRSTDKLPAFYIPYSAKPGAYEIASIADVFDGAELDLSGKIVLIGPYDAGLGDKMLTPIDHGIEMFGVEVHANVIESFLRGIQKSEISAALQAAVVFVCLSASLIFLWDRKILTATLFWFGITVMVVVIEILAFRRGFVTHALWLPLGLTIIYVVSVALNYIRAAMEKRRVTGTFKRYVAPEIVNEILREGTDALGLGGKLVDIAVLFVDIRGFTPMSEILTPPQVVEVLNSYLKLTSVAIMNNSGTLDKFIGDATMAFWGAPLPQDDCVFKAIKTALEMVEGSKALSEELAERFGRTVSFGIGVHFGPAVVGNIGAEARMDYTAIGDTVNTAARLESNAPAGTILCSRAVADALEGRVRFTSLGDSIKLKGKAEGFEILTVDGLVD
ncbi:MAG: adenylate/guanylate cyclase domain-containing protein [Oscillospiraceae bacterium]|jgi:adenylate cyclase|nr:adenylate/guanylate cyclase domain-containing protein [Oscillospiraceae bacterium]